MHTVPFLIAVTPLDFNVFCRDLPESLVSYSSGAKLKLLALFREKKGLVQK